MIISYLHIVETSALELLVLHFPQIHVAVHNSFKNTILCTQFSTVTFPSNSQIVERPRWQLYQAQIICKGLYEKLHSTTIYGWEETESVCDKAAAWWLLVELCNFSVILYIPCILIKNFFFSFKCWFNESEIKLCCHTSTALLPKMSYNTSNWAQ